MFEIDLAFFESLKEKPHAEAIMLGALWAINNGFKIIPAPPNSKALGVPENQASNDKKVIENWFLTDFFQGNFHLVFGNTGVSVFDIDCHGDVDGFRSLGIDRKMLGGLVVATPNNGVHLYVIGDVPYKKLPPGVEHKKSYILAPPSRIDGKSYEWISGGTPQPLSQRMVAAIKGIKLYGVETSRVAKIVAPSPAPTIASSVITATAPAPAPSPIVYLSSPVAPPDYIRLLLEHIDPGTDYDEWSKVGMALHHNDDSEASLAIWMEWSSESAKYKIGECEKKWASFSQFKGNPVTLRWLIFTSKQNGCPDHPQDALYYGGSLAIDIEVEKMNKKYIYRRMQNSARICWLEKTSEGHLQLFQWKETDFKSLMQNQCIMVGTKMVPIAELWLRSSLRRTGEVNMWEIGKEPPNALNIFQGLAVEPVPCVEEEIAFFLDFILSTICRGNKTYAHYLLDLLATKLQHPLKITGICLVLQGGEGTGKGSLCRVMETIIGRAHSSTVSQRNSLLGDYAGGLIANALWVTANEAIWAGHHGEAERLKAITTEPNIEWNNKFTPMWEQRNCIQLSMTTNNDWAVPADADSRRFLVLRVSDERAKNDAYWDSFNELLGRDAYWKPNNPEYLGKVLYYLQQRVITSSFKNALETEWLIQQRGQTVLETQDDAFVEWFKLFLRDNAGDVFVGQSGNFSFAVVHKKGIAYVIASDLYTDYRHYVKKHFHGRKPFTNDKFNAVLHALGMVQSRVRKSTLMLGQSKYPGNPNSKVSIALLVDPDELEAALVAKYQLLNSAIPDAEDDDDDL